MEQHGRLERALVPAAPYLAGLAAIYAMLSGLVWLAGEMAGWLWTRRWPPAGGGAAAAVLAGVLRDPTQPSLAWPAAARHDLAPAPLFYALVAVLVIVVAVPATRLAVAYRGRRRRWSDPNLAGRASPAAPRSRRWASVRLRPRGSRPRTTSGSAWSAGRWAACARCVATETGRRLAWSARPEAARRWA